MNSLSLHLLRFLRNLCELCVRYPFPFPDLLPREQRLLKVRNAGMPPRDANLAELIQNCGGGRGDGVMAKRHAQHRVIAVLDRVEQRRVGAHEFLQRDAVNAGHFGGIARELARRPGPDDHGGNDEAGPGGEIVESPQYGAGLQPQAYFFVELTQRSLLRRFTDIDAATGQGPLARVAAQAK